MTIFKAQFFGELLPVRLADIFLDLKSPLQALPLEVAEDGPPHHAPAGFSPAAVRPWERAGEGKDGGLGARNWRRYWKLIGVSFIDDFLI